LLLTLGSHISAGQTIPAIRYDSAPQSDTSFHATEVKRQKVTTTTVLLTLTAKMDVAQLDLKLSGTTAELHHSEMKADLNERSISGLQAGQKPQLTGQITTAAGQSGQISISGRATNSGFAVPDVNAHVPFQNQKGQLKLSSPTGSGPVGVSAKPTSQTVGDGYVVKGDVTVSLKAVSDVPAAGLTVDVNAEGITLLTSAPSQSQPPTASDVTRSITFVARDGQKGRILTQITGKTRNGKDYVRRSYLYVLATPNQLFTSSSGFVDLDIQKLKADLDTHLVTSGQFAAGMNAILSGATESGVAKQ
jgi:hypothetical protein